MTNRQKLELRMSTVRRELNELNSKPELTDEDRSSMDTLSNEYSDLERRYSAETISDDEPTPSDPQENRERLELRQAAHVSEYVSAALEQRAVGGAAKDFNDSLDIPANRFPLELLVPLEERAETDVDSGTSQRPWIDRLFSEAAAMRLGVTFASVPAGVQSVPVTKTGPTPAQRGREEAAADGSWTVEATEIKPTRNAVRVLLTEEDSYRLPGLEDSLTRDLRMANTEAIDRAIFLGDAGADENPADIVGLNTAGIAEKTLKQADKVKAPETLAAFAEMVDGKHATGLGDLNVVASVGTNALWLSTIASAAADTKTLASFFRENGLMWGVRGDLSGATTDGAIGAYIGRARGIAGAATAAIWNSAMLIRDPYTGAKSGEVALTLSTFWGFKIVRASNFARLKFVA